MSDDEDRATRLRRRRQRSSARADAEDDATHEAEGASADDEAAPPGSAENADDVPLGSVKEEQVGTYMYLPEWQKREIERVYGLLSTEYEYRFDEEFEKNRHFYPLLVTHGLDELDGLDAEDVRERLATLHGPDDD